jgi:hypothetical protein
LLFIYLNALVLFGVESPLINKYSNVMKKLFWIFAISTTVYGCATSKNVAYQQPKNTPVLTRSRSIESQRELANLMDTWSCEEIEEFKRDFVFTRVNIINRNGDTVVVK